MDDKSKNKFDFERNIYYEEEMNIKTTILKSSKIIASTH
jgi:hypothetical protein